MQQQDTSMIGRCRLQLMGLRDMYFDVEYSLLLHAEAEPKNTEAAILNIRTVQGVPLPPGMYLLKDLPGQILCYTKEQWLFVSHSRTRSNSS